MSLVRAFIASALQPTTEAIAAAWTGLDKPHGLHVDTRMRAAHRTLLDAAGILEAQVRIGFIKLDGSLRYMLALPVVEADPTSRYYTVQDLELSERADRKVYRRINLDTIAAVQINHTAHAA